MFSLIQADGNLWCDSCYGYQILDAAHVVQIEGIVEVFADDFLVESEAHYLAGDSDLLEAKRVVAVLLLLILPS